MYPSIRRLNTLTNWAAPDAKAALDIGSYISMFIDPAIELTIKYIYVVQFWIKIN